MRFREEKLKKKQQTKPVINSEYFKEQMILIDFEINK